MLENCLMPWGKKYTGIRIDIGMTVEVQNGSSRAKSKGLAGLCYTSGGSREEFTSCVLQLLEAACTSWLSAPSNNRITVISASRTHLLTLTLQPSSFMHKDPCDYIKPTFIIQANLSISKFLITFSTSLLPRRPHVPVF